MDRPFPAYEGDEPYVFVCYAHEDANVVYPELQRLHDSGVNIWYDEGIAPGHEWTQELADAIEGSSQLLNFVSPASVASRHCRSEVQYALEQDKALVSVYLEPTELPGGLKLSLGLAQAIMKYDLSAEDYQRKVSDSLRVSNVAHESPAPVSVDGSRRWPTFTAVFVALAIIAAVGIWWTQQREPPIPEHANEAATTSTSAIAVLPFVNMSNDPEQEFFSDGISEDILNELARSTDLTVRPRSSSFQFKASKQDSQTIGRRLNVTHVVEGSVRKSGERIRVSVHLIDVAENRSIWSQRYDRELVDVFKVQDEITGEILAALNVHLRSRDSPRPFASNEAYNAFLRGRHEFNQFDFAEADRWLGTAVTLDPQNADAWALRALINSWQSSFALSPNGGEHLDRRRDYVNRALSIDPTNADALGTRALMDTHYVNRDYQAAVNELVRLVRLHPNNAEILNSLSYVLIAVGRADLVQRVTARAVELAPLSRRAWATRIAGLMLVGPLESFRQAMNEYSSLGYYEPPYSAELALADLDLVALEAVIPQDHWGSGIHTFYAALVPYLKGEFEAAREIVATLKHSEGYQPLRIKAQIALVEQDIDAALANYRRAILAGEQNAITGARGSIGQHRVFPEYYADPRYSQMLRDFKLDPESMAKIHVPDLPF